MDIFIYMFYYSVITLCILRLLNDLIEVKKDQLKIDVYRPPSCNFHATHFMMSLCHLIMSALVIIDGFSCD